jgi:hypothetical protein
MLLHQGAKALAAGRRVLVDRLGGAFALPFPRRPRERGTGMARDVRTEMSRQISAALAGELVNAEGAGTIARDLVRRLRAEDPALLVGWLQAHAVEALGQHIARRHPAPVRHGPGPEALAARKTRAQQADATA